MKRQVLTVLCLAVFSGLFFPASSQNTLPSSLEGAWVLDSVEVVQTENGRSSRLADDSENLKKDFNLGIYDELDFKDGNLSAFKLGMEEMGQVSVAGDHIEYNGAPAPLEYAWKVEQNHLYLIRECTGYFSGKPDNRYRISLIYLRKN